MSLDGYPLAYCIHEGNKYEGHTMLPMIESFIRKYELENFVVVADSGLMNNDNITRLENERYKYILCPILHDAGSKLMFVSVL